jgi:hypothetical protein
MRPIWIDTTINNRRRSMLPEKNALSLEEIDEQSALELPQRELLTLVLGPRIDIDTTNIEQNATVLQLNVAGGDAFQANVAKLVQVARA